MTGVSTVDLSHRGHDLPGLCRSRRRGAPARAGRCRGHGARSGRAALRRQVTSHTLMTAGVIAAVAIGQWTTAALIVFFMRFADLMEELTTERSRRAIKQPVALAPATARILRDGQEIEVPVDEVMTDEVVLVRPGERIPVDGQVVDGFAPVDESSITGESVPRDVGPDASVFAATVAQAGFLKVQATRIGADTTFGRIIRLVEEAEAQKAPIQRFADRFERRARPRPGRRRRGDGRRRIRRGDRGSRCGVAARGLAAGPRRRPPRTSERRRDPPESVVHCRLQRRRNRTGFRWTAAAGLGGRCPEPAGRGHSLELGSLAPIPPVTGCLGAATRRRAGTWQIAWHRTRMC
jgi:hypothetical protein